MQYQGFTDDLSNRIIGFATIVSVFSLALADIAYTFAKAIEKFIETILDASNVQSCENSMHKIFQGIFENGFEP